jgi:hypothetical protein
LAKYNPDTDPLQGYGADLAEQLETDAASRAKILTELGGQTRTTVNFAASRNSSALTAAAGAAVNTSLAEIPRATLPKPTATTPVDPSGNVIARNRMPQLPDVDLQAGKTKALERQVMGLSNHIVSGSAGLPLQTSQPSLRDGLWH